MRTDDDRTAKSLAATVAAIAAGIGFMHWLSTRPRPDSRHYWLLWTLSVLGLMLVAALYFFGAFEVWSYIHHTTRARPLDRADSRRARSGRNDEQSLTVGGV